MKKFLILGILFAIFLVFETINIYAQAISLRRGFYRTRGSEDEILILPNTIFDSKADGFRQRYGYYGMSVWSGSVRNDKIKFITSGIISGNKIHFIIEEANEDITREIIYTIVRYQAFLDNTGHSWIWHRDNRGY